MENFNQKVLFFHICTDGVNNGIIHLCEEDYEQANKTTAVAAFSAKVKILAFDHMSTHSHFVVWCNSRGHAEAFISKYKQKYGYYVQQKHGISGVYRRVDVTIKQITDIKYLKTCIAYTLLNPVAAHIVSRPEDYKWSSFKAYFTDSLSNEGMVFVKSLTAREIRHLFRTHIDISESGIIVDRNGDIVLKSFVDFKTIEKLFKGQTEFFRTLALTDSASEELKYVNMPSIVTYSDNDLIAEAASLVRKFHGHEELQKLTIEQRIRLIHPLKKKTGVSAPRIARVLRINPVLVRRLLGGN